MSIRTLLDQELAAYCTLSIATGFSAGAFRAYYADIKGELIDPYASAASMRYVLMAYRNKATPAALASLVRTYITFALSKVMWKFTSIGENQIVELRDGSAFAIPKEYRTPAAEAGGKVTLYNTTQRAQVAKNVAGLFIKGCPLTSYVRTTDGTVLPGWVLKTPNMSFTTPLQKISGTTYREIHDTWYDASDSASATLVALIGEYLKTLPDSEFFTWINKNWETLFAVTDACLATLDSISNLCMATPYSTAEYTLDNIEVWRAITEICGIIRRAISVDSSQPSTSLEGANIKSDHRLRKYESYRTRIHSAINLHCRLSKKTPKGIFTPGWNGEIQIALNSHDETNPEYLDAFSFSRLHDFPLNDSATGYLDSAVSASYFSTMSKQGLPQPTMSTYPGIWRYVCGVDAIGTAQAPFKRTTYENWIHSINETCIIGANRNYKCWGVLESGSFILLCSALLDKGAH
ncbi:hypothetical protein [Burkholderia cepacia]|uniref:hypothetical protein n=1 Tax=Burkholderia cepacia TaxID=292 RepID=UPI000F593655|nr:hypothetical protein [Burkholderia cepacia]